MSDTFTTALAIRLPATGAYNNTWGAVLNSNALQLFDTAIAGLSQISIGSSTSYSMPAMAQGADCPSRYFCIQFSGTPASQVTVTLPASVVSKFYLVDNLATGQTLVFTYAGSTNTVSVLAGTKHLIWCDGANVWDCTTAGSTLLSGIAATNFARVSRTAAEIAGNTVVQNVYTGVNNVQPFNTLTLPVGSTITLDPTQGNVQQITLTGNYIFGVPANAQDGSAIELYVIQDGTGSRTATWNSVFLFEGGTSPTLTTTPGAVDKFEMRYNGTLTKWLVVPYLNVTTPAGAQYPLTIASNVSNWQLAPLLGTLGSPVNVTVTVNTGVVVSSVRPSDPAMDLSGLPSGSTVTLVNNGYIIGCGGNGGEGASSVYNGTSPEVTGAGLPEAGGVAVLGPGIGRSFNCTNANGHLWGGGGGGGGGSAQTPDSATGNANAGGGGGGAGGGRGGRGGRSWNQSTNPNAGLGGNGANGTGGPNGTGGSAGAGTSAGSANLGVAGAGGAYGSAGANGTAASPNTAGYGPPTNGGSAGNSIALAGGSVVPPSPAGSVLGPIS
jgi:hypothetical protein